MEVTTTFASDIAEIKERLHALDGKGEVEEDTEEHHEEATQPVATTEEKHEEAPQPTAPVATETPVTPVTPVAEPTVTPVTETPVQPVAETQPVATPTVEATVTPTAPTATETPVAPVAPTTAQGDGNNESNGKIEEHHAETTVSGDNING